MTVRLLTALFIVSLGLNARLVWDQQISLTPEEPRYDIHVAGKGMVVLHDRLGEEHRVRFADGKLLSPSCSASRIGWSTGTDITHVPFVHNDMDVQPGDVLMYNGNNLEFMSDKELLPGGSTTIFDGDLEWEEDTTGTITVHNFRAQ